MEEKARYACTILHRRRHGPGGRVPTRVYKGGVTTREGAITSRERFVAGDALRGYMSVLVVLMHVVILGTILEGKGGDIEASFGKVPGRAILDFELSIYVFFTLSAYLLARPYVRALLLGERFPSVLDYGVGRILRVVPAFWILTTIVLVRFGARGAPHDQVAAIYGFVQTLDRGPVDVRMNQAWTLDAEMFFYLLLPVGAVLAALTLGRLRSNWTKVGIAGVVLTIVFVLSYRYRAGAQAGFPEANPLAMVCAFLPGIALAAIEALGAERLPGWRWGPAVAWGCLAATAVGLLLGMTLSRERLAARTLVGIVACSFLVAAPLVLQWTRGRTWRVLEWGPAHWLGIRSFSFYLIHTAVILELLAWARHGHTALAVTALTFPPVLVISAVLSALSYRFVELPGIGLRKPVVRRLRGPLRKLPAGAVPAPAITPRPGSSPSAPETPPP
ncbi:MAG: acyltransferase 3 [Solirubrobacterales bacterium]|nr:acyltransferase 3 [Solirubrobacterales bacterium]